MDENVYGLFLAFQSVVLDKLNLPLQSVVLDELVLDAPLTEGSWSDFCYTEQS